MSLRKKVVSSAAALAIMGSSLVAAPNASTQVATDGTGDYLVFPVYAADNNGNWKTNVKVVNTNTTAAVVAKVVIREAVNSVEKLDFVIYLSPGDVWEAEIYSDAANNVYIKSTDDSMIQGGQIASAQNPINLALYAPVAPENYNYGYVEVYGLGAVNPGLVPDYDGDQYVWGGANTPMDKDDLYRHYVNTLHNQGAGGAQGAGWTGVDANDLYGVEVIYAKNANGNLAMTLPAFAMEGVTGSLANGSAVFGANSTPNNSIIVGGTGDAALVTDVINNMIGALAKTDIYATYYEGVNGPAETKLIMTQPFKYVSGLDSLDCFNFQAVARDQQENANIQVTETSGGVVIPDSCKAESCWLDVTSKVGSFSAGYVDYSNISNYYDFYVNPVTDQVEADGDNAGETGLAQDATGITTVTPAIIPVLMTAKNVEGQNITNIVYPPFRSAD